MKTKCYVALIVWYVIACAVVWLCGGCARYLEKMFDKEPSPKEASVKMPPLPPGAEAFTVGRTEDRFTLASVPVLGPIKYLRWQHNQRTGETYEVWCAPNFNAWTLATNTAVKVYAFRANGLCGYFRVRARNSAGQVSDWGTTTP